MSEEFQSWATPITRAVKSLEEASRLLEDRKVNLAVAKLMEVVTLVAATITFLLSRKN